MLSVHVHIHGALQSLYRDSAVHSRDYCEPNVSLFATVGNDRHGRQQFLQFLYLITVIFCWWADENKVVLRGTRVKSRQNNLKDTQYCKVSNNLLF